MENKAHNECPVPNGKLMLIGGNEEKNKTDDATGKELNLKVLAQFIKLIDQEQPKLIVVTTAGEEDVVDTFETYKRTFEKICTCEVTHLHHSTREEINNEEAVLAIAGADAIFFAGGDQLKLTSIYGGTNLMYEIKKRYISEGLVIGGTSAGAMALSTPMIFAGTGADEMIAGEVKITTGFEFLKDVCVDTHFVHRGRFTRMAQVIATNPACIGIGVEEDTAVIVANGVEATVFGTGVVIVIDGIEATDNNVTEFNSRNTLNIRNLKVAILSSENQFIIPQRNPPHQ
jgi:cyanophycinase